MSGKKSRGKRVALLIHPLHIYGGAEYELKVITKLFPDATIFTAWYDEHFVKEHFPDCKIVTSFLQYLPAKNKLHKEYIPLLQYGYRVLNFKGFEKIIILSDGFEKFISPPKETKKVLIVMTPPRFLWLKTRSLKGSKRILYRVYRKLLQRFLHPIWKRADQKAAQQFNNIYSISKEVQERVAKFYGVHSEILYPPVDIDAIKFNPMLENREDWYLYFGRVESYKGVELLIRTAISHQFKVKIAGKGGDLEKMKGLIGELGGDDYVEMLGYVSNEEKTDLLFKCKALIYPVRDEDFGIVPIEANAAGCPVVAFNGGGVKESIVDGVTGVFFTDFTVEGLKDGIDRIKTAGINPEKCLEQAQLFKKESFESKLMTIVNNL